MKKLTGIIISIIMLMTLFSVMSSAEDLVVLRSIRDLTKYTTESLRDESSDAGAIYGLSDPAAFEIELVNEGSKPLIKYTVNGGQTQHLHDKLNLKAEGSMNIFAEGPEAFRFYVKTEDSSLAIAIRFDVTAPERALFFTYDSYLVDMDMKEVDFDSLEDAGSVVVPPDFEGYIVCKFADDYFYEEDEVDNPVTADAQVYQFMYRIRPYDTEMFENVVFYMGDIESISLSVNVAPTVSPDASPIASPDASPAESPVATVSPDATATANVSPSPSDDKTDLANDNTVWIIIGCVAAAAVIAAVIIVIVKKNKAKK